MLVSFSSVFPWPPCQKTGDVSRLFRAVPRSSAASRGGGSLCDVAEPVPVASPVPPFLSDLELTNGLEFPKDLDSWLTANTVPEFKSWKFKPIAEPKKWSTHFCWTQQLWCEHDPPWCPHRSSRGKRTPVEKAVEGTKFGSFHWKKLTKRECLRSY